MSIASRPNPSGQKIQPVVMARSLLFYGARPSQKLVQSPCFPVSDRFSDDPLPRQIGESVMSPSDRQPLERRRTSGSLNGQPALESLESSPDSLDSTQRRLLGSAGISPLSSLDPEPSRVV